MKVIFLDIDGVLNVIPTCFDKYGAVFHEHFVKNLERVIADTDAKIVISSTWRLSGFEAMKDMWVHRNLPGTVVGVTEYDEDACRGLEIMHWLIEHPVDNYVIIDDDDDMLQEQMNNFVKTAENSTHPDCIDIGYGLTSICADAVIKILNE